MRWNNRVIWSEGMLLQQQHLQQQDRYWHSLIEARCGTQRRYGWGFWTLTIDEQQLALGKVGLSACDGVMPDGTFFALPLEDELPLALEIPETKRSALVVLALPLLRPGVAEVAELGERTGGDDRYARYRRAQRTVFDSQADGRDSAVMELGKLSLRLAFAEDVSEGFATLGVARVVERRADNLVVLKRRYAPPCLDYRVAPRLAGFVDELVGLLDQRGQALAERLAQPGAGGVAQIADFLLLQTINRAQPLFAHLASVKGLHPESLYRSLLQLAGDLSGFVQGGGRPAAPAPYRHDDLAAAFEPLTAALRRALSMVIEPQAVSIRFERADFGVRVARLADPALFKTAEFVLAVKAQMPTRALTASVSAQMKVGPVEKIHDLVNLQLPGVHLRMLPVAPRQLPFHAGCSYFALDSNDALWSQTAGSAGIALHVAGDFPGLEVELWAIR